ncbi:Os05g0475475 [Oryza sativa Japonica Group]|uniref:Os05g0475475 protein n=1 Tax=Oryza sativa subsp. japonica TaxID=39947 RepID=A0A0P0WNS0_ORYSJ|nr:Os05g0475475 [Oryza sativa Japonica Group]
MATSVKPGNHQCKLVRLRARIFFSSYLQITRHFGCQCLGKICNSMIQVKNCGVLYPLCLVDHRLNNIRMAVPATNGCNATKSIQVTAAILVEQVLHFPIDYVQLKWRS